MMGSANWQYLRFVLEWLNGSRLPAVLNVACKARTSYFVQRISISNISKNQLQYTVANKNEKQLSPEQQKELLSTLKTRFEKNSKRHKGIEWDTVQAKLEANKEKLWSLYEMESTGGEPDVVGQDTSSGEYFFYDCAAESPKGRRSICYDHKALESRKENKPPDSAVNMAAAMGIEILTEEQYRELQQLEKFDTKTSSWVKTPDTIRSLGGAIFCDRRYDTVFTYHNGAESYYAGRAFRGLLRV